MAVRTRPRIGDLEHCYFTFAQDYGVRPGAKIDCRIVSRIWPIGRYAASLTNCKTDHRKGGFTSCGCAHLGEEVEIVFHQQNDIGLQLTKPRFECADTIFERRVKQCDFMPVLAEQRRSDQRGERRIGFHPLMLLEIPCQEIRMSKQDHAGRSAPSVCPEHLYSAGVTQNT